VWRSSTGFNKALPTRAKRANRPRVVMDTAVAAAGHRFQLARIGHNRFVTYLFDYFANPCRVSAPVSSATRAPGGLADR
jgi:hypothetical protein